MNVISKRGLLKLAARHADALDPLIAWFHTARKAEWRGLNDVRKDLPSADQVGEVLVFNIKGNRYRLIARVNYRRQRIFVKELLTHAEYDREEWMKWA
ncbi:MAG: type II toxin-antitoxin system HigB family toxin [Acidobacteria bacterium]|nr:type II toxin-antitoxin system HigB family toxin [Acidobacteriota bacterium]